MSHRVATLLVLWTRRVLAIILLARVPAPVGAVEQNILGLTSPGPPSGETGTLVVAQRLSADIVVDGRLDEQVWLNIPASSGFLQRDPQQGQQATERTEVRVGYDSRGLYVGISLFDRDPLRIERRFSRRDTVAGDTVALYLDPRRDGISGALFQVSATGVQKDGIIYNDFEIDEAWDAVWSSAVGLDDRGWTAEIMIPLSQLRFDPARGTTWGINVERFIHRRNESDWLQLVPKDERRLSSRMARLSGVDEVESRAHLEFLPYTAGRVERVSSGAGNPFNDGSRHFGAAGLDVKWGLSSALTIDATVNPDFGQVEVDPSVINLTEFETSFEERRPFFLEGAQTFTNFGRNGAGSSPLSHDMFHSRRVGREPQGRASGSFVDVPRATTILGAAKLTGKTAGGWSVGLLEAMTTIERARVFVNGETTSVPVEPQTNYSVGRVFREADRAGGGILLTAVNRSLGGTKLVDLLPRQAYAGGFDGYVFLDSQKAWVLSGLAAGSHLTGSSAAIERLQRSSRRYFQRPDAGYVRLDPNATSLSGWSGALSLRRKSGSVQVDTSLAATTPGFELNDLGFQRRADDIEARGGVTWAKYTPDRFTHYRSLSARKSSRWNFGGSRQRDAWSVDTSLTFLNFWYANGGVSLNLDALDDHLTRGGPLAAAPRSTSVYLSFGTDSRQRVWVGGGSTHGRNEAGGWEVSSYLTAVVRPSQRIRMSTGPYFYRGRNVAQFVSSVVDPGAVHTYGRRYIFANLGQTQLSMTTRADIALSPTVSLQFYVEPFIGVGRYGDLQELRAPRTFSFLRYGKDIGLQTLDAKEQVYTIDPDGPGLAEPFTVAPQDFNYKSLVAKAVFRWEWRPGSTLYVAWTQDRFDDQYEGDFNLGRDVRAILRAPADDVLMVKMAYWFSR